MGYLSILLALLAGTTKGFFGKRVSSAVSTQRQAVFVNALRMLICVLISLAVLLPELLRGEFRVDGATWLFGAMAGITVSLFMVTWLLAVRRGAFMLISVAQTLGVVVTLVCSLVVFRTPITPRQLLAMLLLLVAVLIMCSYSATLKGRLTAGVLLLLGLCALSSGLYDFSLKLFTYYSCASISTLNLISYAIASVALGAFFLLPTQEKDFDAKQLLRITGLPLLVMSLCLFLNSYFKALANNYLPPTQVYPIYQAGGLIFSAAMSALFFRERITPRCVIGLCLSFIAILLLK